MLVLSRKRGESIVIGNNIKLTLVDIRGDKVRLDIEAPTDISVFRKEVLDRMRAEGQLPVVVDSPINQGE